VLSWISTIITKGLWFILLLAVSSRSVARLCRFFWVLTYASLWTLAWLEFGLEKSG
jgi:hypothetical protein